MSTMSSDRLTMPRVVNFGRVSSESPTLGSHGRPKHMLWLCMGEETQGIRWLFPNPSPLASNQGAGLEWSRHAMSMRCPRDGPA